MDSFDINSGEKIKPGFRTPDNYFDDLQSKVFGRLEEPQVIPINRRRNFIMAAAAVLILALMVPVYNSYNTTTELDESTLESYLAYQSGLTQFDLLYEMEPDDLAEMEVVLPADDAVIEDALISNSDIEQLLIE